MYRSNLERGMSEAELGWTASAFDPEVLTIGFARRVPSYKRLTLMLRDPDRLRALLLDPERPVQIVIAGKSHPDDDGGKQLIAQMVRFADDPAVRHRITFLPDYDIGMARYLYWGVDVWLNNPLRPLEACGTSGMKAALNGALNLSIRDGWWDEWFDGENGWAIPSAEGLSDPDRRDDLEANALYDLIEKSVAPRFYDRKGDGVPTRWIQMVRHTLKSLGPKVLATRMVAEYVRRLYAPAAGSSERMFADNFAAARSLATWRTKVEENWPAVAVLHVDSQLSGSGDAEVGQSLGLRAEVALGQLAPDDVCVEAVYGSVSYDDRLTDMGRVVLHAVPNGDGTHHYEGEIPLDRTGGYGYTVRVLPHSDLLVTPAELGLVASA
jgi:starch phosphorylase